MIWTHLGKVPQQHDYHIAVGHRYFNSADKTTPLGLVLNVAVLKESAIISLKVPVDPT